MKKVVKIGFIPIILIVVGFGYWFFQQQVLYDATSESIEFIAQHFNNKGEFIDYYGEINMQDPSTDLKLFVDGKDVRIEFGNINLTWKLKDFVTEETQNQLKKIHIRAFKDKTTGRLRVFYFNQEIERWVS